MADILRKISRFFQDEEGHWVAEMECGHTQHMRHDPPWQTRPWVLTQAGRDTHQETPLKCKECNEAACEPVSKAIVERKTGV